MDVEARLRELGIELPAVMPPVGNYIGGKIVGHLLFMSGHGPAEDGRLPYIGKLGRELTTEEGYQAARLVALNVLATAREILRDLSRIKGVVKVLGMVNVAEGYTETPKVINGASDLFVEIFGESGRHARSAVGMAALPFNIPVEIEVIFLIE